MGIINWIVENYQMVISAAVGILGGLIAIFMLIPGEQPEKALEWVLGILKKLSLK